MAHSDVTSSSPSPDPSDDRNRKPRHVRRRLPVFLVFGIVAATIEMGIVLALLYC